MTEVMCLRDITGECKNRGSEDCLTKCRYNESLNNFYESPHPYKNRYE